MSIMDFFRSRKNTTASTAKERLQIIVAERRNQDDPVPAYLPQLKVDIMQVLSKYVEITPDMVDISLEQSDGNLSVLELNVKLPDEG